MDELQTCIQLTLAVLPSPSVLFQPSETPFHDPALGHDLEGRQRTALGELHRHLFPQYATDTLRKALPNIITIRQQVLKPLNPGWYR